MTAGAVMARARFGTVRAALEPMTGLHSPPRRTRDCPARTVERLMKTMGLQGVVRGKKVVTTNPDTAQPCPDDKVNRAFKADMPNQLWVSDFTYVSSWQGMVYVAIRRENSPLDCFLTLLIHRRLCPEDRWLARLNLDDDRFCSRCPEPGHLPEGTIRS